MKKLLLFCILLNFGISMLAYDQYSKIIHYFNSNVVDSEFVDTRIEIADSTITICTSNESPLEYLYKDNVYYAVHHGDADNPELLSNGLVGCESVYIVYTKKDLQNIDSIAASEYNSLSSEQREKETAWWIRYKTILKYIDNQPIVTIGQAGLTKWLSIKRSDGSMSKYCVE